MKSEHKVGLLSILIGVGLMIMFLLVDDFQVLSLGIVFGGASAFNILYGLKLLKDNGFFKHFIEENE